MWKCPVCEETGSSLLCENCGFDGSRDYERYPSFGKLPFVPEAISSLRKAHCKEEDLSLCPHCEGSHFSIDLTKNRYVCADCGRMLTVHMVEEDTDTEKPPYHLKWTNIAASILFLVSLIKILIGILEIMPQPETGMTLRVEKGESVQEVFFNGTDAAEGTREYVTAITIPTTTEIMCKDNITYEFSALIKSSTWKDHLDKSHLSRGEICEYMDWHWSLAEIHGAPDNTTMDAYANNSQNASANLLTRNVDFGMTSVCNADLLTSFRKRLLLCVEE